MPDGQHPTFPAGPRSPVAGPPPATATGHPPGHPPTPAASHAAGPPASPGGVPVLAPTPPDRPPGSPARPAGPDAARPTWRRRIHNTLDIIRAKPTGRVALKVFIGTLGAVVVAVGIVLIPLPGPGWALVILGLAIWAVEFVWAKHLLRFTRRHVQGWTRWVTRQSLPLRIVIGAVGIVFVGATVWTSVRMSTGVDLVAFCWNFLASR